MAHAHHHQPDLSAGNTTGIKHGGPFLAAGALAAIGAFGMAGGLGADGARAYVVFMTVAFATCLGALFFVIVQHLTRAGWSVAVRRPAEALAQNLRWMWVLFLPIAWMGWTGRLVDLYPWADLDVLRSVSPAEADLVANKAGYLNQKFFFVRSAIYLAVWAGLAQFFWSSSVRQDRTGDPAISASCRRWAGPAMILFGLTSTFASFDWIMSLSPAWFSTMFGVYFFALSATLGLASITLLCKHIERGGRLHGIVTVEHYHDLGKMLFAFGIVFWAYIAFSQFMLIWYGNLPEETAWFLPRQVGAWLPISWMLLIGHFIVPFVFLVSRWTKRWGGTLAFACLWMLAFGCLDVVYLVVPHVPHDLGEFATYAEFAEKHAGDGPHGAGSLALFSVAALLLAQGGAMLALAGKSLVPVRDPSLAESLAFQNM
jgi:hypothetical protein